MIIGYLCSLIFFFHYDQTEKNNYPQNLMDLKHLLFTKHQIIRMKKSHFHFLNIVKQIDLLTNFPFPFFLFGVNFYGVLFYGDKMKRKPVDQTGAKTKNHYIAFLQLLFLSYCFNIAVGNVGHQRHSIFLSFSQAYIMKAVVSLSKFRVCTNTYAHTNTYSHAKQ